MALWTSFRVGSPPLSSLMGHCESWLAISGSAELSSFKYSWNRPALMDLLSFKRVYAAFECGGLSRLGQLTGFMSKKFLSPKSASLWSSQAFTVHQLFLTSFLRLWKSDLALEYADLLTSRVRSFFHTRKDFNLLEIICSIFVTFIQQFWHFLHWYPRVILHESRMVKLRRRDFSSKLTGYFSWRHSSRESRSSCRVVVSNAVKVQSLPVLLLLNPPPLFKLDGHSEPDEVVVCPVFRVCHGPCDVFELF